MADEGLISSLLANRDIVMIPETANMLIPLESATTLPEITVSL